ncbi:hypothetical protein SprV_0602242700 [Sparganum proliferum]
MHIDGGPTSFSNKLMDLTLDLPLAQHVKDSVAVLEDDIGVEIIENSGKAEHLGRYFASVFTRETEFRSRSANNAVETAGPVLDSILFSTAVVERELQNLKEARSSGPENIPANFLKELAKELSKPLANTFRSSFESGKLPSEWKTANIFPICKGGARTSANNYRPVSLNCICCKIMEAIVKKATIKFLEQNHIPSDRQHGFRQNRSCLSSLLLSTEQWTRALDEDGRVDVIYTDFKQLRSDLIQTYRIVKGRECALDFDEFFELAGTGRLRGHPFKL